MAYELAVLLAGGYGATSVASTWWLTMERVVNRHEVYNKRRRAVASISLTFVRAQQKRTAAFFLASSMLLFFRLALQPFVDQAVLVPSRGLCDSVWRRHLTPVWISWSRTWTGSGRGLSGLRIELTACIAQTGREGWARQVVEALGVPWPLTVDQLARDAEIHGKPARHGARFGP